MRFHRHLKSLFVACAVASVVCLVLGNRRAHEVVVWWPAIMATTLAMVGLARAACRGVHATVSLGVGIG